MKSDRLIARIDASPARIEEFCRNNHIKKLALFGSVLRDDFRPDSDIDVLGCWRSPENA
jgi:predicted nucleotidyltransferase